MFLSRLITIYSLPESQHLPRWVRKQIAYPYRLLTFRPLPPGRSRSGSHRSISSAQLYDSADLTAEPVSGSRTVPTLYSTSFQVAVHRLMIRDHPRPDQSTHTLDNLRNTHGDEQRGRWSVEFRLRELNDDLESTAFAARLTLILPSVIILLLDKLIWNGLRYVSGGLSGVFKLNLLDQEPDTVSFQFKMLGEFAEIDKSVSWSDEGYCRSPRHVASTFRSCAWPPSSTSRRMKYRSDDVVSDSPQVDIGPRFTVNHHADGDVEWRSGEAAGRA